MILFKRRYTSQGARRSDRPVARSESLGGAGQSRGETARAPSGLRIESGVDFTLEPPLRRRKGGRACVSSVKGEINNQPQEVQNGYENQ